MSSYFDDEDFQDCLTALLCRDSRVLQSCAVLLHPDDFKPLRGHKHGYARWMVVEHALSHFQRYHEPIGRLLRASILDYAKGASLSPRQQTQLQEYLQFLKTLKPAGEAVSEKVVRYKRERMKAAAVQEMAEALAANKLTDERWREISQKVLFPSDTDFAVSDYFGTTQERIVRRLGAQHANRYPYFLIEPLDAITRNIGPGHLGVVVAPPKRGKSLFLLWLAMAYLIQRLGVLFVTLEDPKEDVEDRLDAMVSQICFHNLAEKPKLFEKRFNRFRRLIKSHLHIIDGTQGGMTVPKIEQILMREQDQGFYADAVIIDYDDEITPTKKQTERRMEFADIYRDLRQLSARNNKKIVWTAAQTQRKTESLKIIGGDVLAEDYSKIRKATLAVGMGQGDWGKESIYLWIMASKIDHMHRGCHIMADKDRMLIYDPERTRRAARLNDKEDDAE